MSPKVIVYYAEWTDVDGAERNEKDALRVNSDGPESLVIAAKLCN
jgi:dTDP-4-dehydrorhamnose reductase